ncbi:MAG: YbaK/EbsC family protein [Candidatus Nanopelagicaceae bacterium]
MSESVAAHPSVQRVRAKLQELAVVGEIKILEDSARSAREAADALGVEVGQICSSLIFAVAGAPILILTSGRHRVDTQLVAKKLGVPKLERADADLVRTATGFAIGGVAPIAHATSIATYIDSALGEHEVVWAAAGHPHAVFPTTFAELVGITGAEVIEVAEE